MRHPANGRTGGVARRRLSCCWRQREEQSRGRGEPHVLSELPRPVVWGGVRHSWTITARVMLPFGPLLGPHPPRSPHILSGSVPLPMSSGRTSDSKCEADYLPSQPSPMGWKVCRPHYLRNVLHILSDNLIKTLFLLIMALFSFKLYHDPREIKENLSLLWLGGQDSSSI